MNYLLQEFLIMEGTGVGSWPYTTLLEGINDVLIGKRETFAYGGDAFSVSVSSKTAMATLCLDILDIQESVSIPLADFCNILLDKKKEMEAC